MFKRLKLAAKVLKPIKVVRFFGIMLCVGTLCPALRADSIPDIVAHSKPAIIEVIAFDDQNRPLKTGTGFLITSDGVAATNYHVIQGASSVGAMTNDGSPAVDRRNSNRSTDGAPKNKRLESPQSKPVDECSCLEAIF